MWKTTMKKFRNAYEKRLDKDQLSWYNRSRRKGVDELSVDELIKRHALADYVGTNTKALITKIGEAINRVQENKRYADIHTPVIAGGSLRDMVFGITPNDYDIFVDASNVDDKEDFTLLYLNDLLLELKEDMDIGEALFEEACVKELGKEYGGDPANKFPVYEISREAPDGAIIWDNNVPKIQLISRSDPRLSEAPKEFLDDFDYSAVKALYDPTGEGFFFHKEFKDFLKSKTIEVHNDNTYSRVMKWRNRIYGAKPPFKVVDKRPASKGLKVGPMDVWASSTQKDMYRAAVLDMEARLAGGWPIRMGNQGEFDARWPMVDNRVEVVRNDFLVNDEFQ